MVRDEELKIAGPAWFYLTISDGLFGQVIVDDEGVLSIVPKVFSHCAARIGRQVLQWRSIGGGGRYDNCVVHSTAVGQSLYNLGDRRSLLPDGNVDAIKFLLFLLTIVKPLLVDDCVNGKSSFTEIINIYFKIPGRTPPTSSSSSN